MVINANNIALMDGSPWAASTNRVEIHAVNLEENWNKSLSKLNRPRSKSNWGEDRQTKILDLKKIDHTYTIQGWLIGSPTESAVGSTADKINFMMGSLIHDGGVQNMTYVAQDGTVVWETVNFSKVLTRKDPKNEDQYFVQLNVIEGDDR